MYQVPIDMITSITRVVLAIMSPSFHSALRPYGFSTFSTAGFSALNGTGTAADVDAGVTAAASGAEGVVTVVGVELPVGLCAKDTLNGAPAKETTTTAVARIAFNAREMRLPKICTTNEAP